MPCSAAFIGFPASVRNWSLARSRIAWTDSLFSLQQLVPPNIQLTRLNMVGDTVISAKEPGDKDTPGTPARRFSLQLQGKTVGDLSDQDVIRFVDSIRMDARMNDWLESVKLQEVHAQRHDGRDQREGQAELTFRIDAASGERLIK